MAGLRVEFQHSGMLLSDPPQVLQQLLSESTSTLALEKLSVALASLLLNDSASHATAQAVFALFDDLTQRREDLDLKLSVVGSKQ